MLEVNIDFPSQESFVQGDMGANGMKPGPSRGLENEFKDKPGFSQV